jgi:hypothetical protein
VDYIHAGTVSSSFGTNVRSQVVDMTFLSRLAAATGNPFSINDDAIELAPPADCIGYPTSGLLRINLRISRVLSRILTGKSLLD